MKAEVQVAKSTQPARKALTGLSILNEWLKYRMDKVLQAREKAKVVGG